MKKYLYKIVIASLILMSTTVVKAANEVYYTNRNNIDMTENEYNNLLGLGFTEDQIKDMDENEYLANKDITGTVLAENEKYLLYATVMRNGVKHQITKEITEEEALEFKEQQSQNSYRGPAVGNYYDGVIQAFSIKVMNKIIGVNATYMRYKVDAEWLTMPSDRYHDILGVGFESNKVQMGSTIVFKQKWLTSGGTIGYDSTGYPKTETSGGSAQIQLPSGSLQQLDSYLYFNVRKQTGVGTITTLNTCGDYAHATSYVNPTVIYSYYDTTIAGIDIFSPYGLLYNGQNTPCASFVGTW